MAIPRRSGAYQKPAENVRALVFSVSVFSRSAGGWDVGSRNPALRLAAVPFLLSVQKGECRAGERFGHVSEDRSVSTFWNDPQS